MPKKHWIGVIDGIEDSFNPELWLKKLWSLGGISFAIGQTECFPEPSFKFYVVTKYRMKANKLEAMFTEKVRWLNIVKKSFQLNMAYVTHEGIRVKGPWKIGTKIVEKTWPEECEKLRAGESWKMVRMVSPFSDELDLLGYVRYHELKLADCGLLTTTTPENSEK